jgi:hypothetical protein
MCCILQLKFDNTAAEEGILQMGEKNIYPNFAAKPLHLFELAVFTENCVGKQNRCT